MVFESRERLAGELDRLLQALRELGEVDYAAVFDGSEILFESGEADALQTRLRLLIRDRAQSLFDLPTHMGEAGPEADLFEGFGESEFLLAVLNGKVGLLACCQQAEKLKVDFEELLHALVDRLLRFDERYRLDASGGGLFFGRPRLDVVVIGRAEDEPRP